MRKIETIKRITAGIMICAFGLVYPVVSGATEGEGINIVDYGLYETSFLDWKEARQTSRGQIQLVEGIQLLKATDTIPAQAGTKVGIRYVLNNEVEDPEIKVHVKVSYADLKSKRTVFENEWVSARRIGTLCFDGWKFKEGTRIAPGKLTIQLYHEGVKLAEKCFTVYNP